MTQSTDRIERQILLKAPRSRVWRALTDAEEVGAWFGADLTGQTIAAGQRVRGPVTHPGYEHLMHDVVYERVEPERFLSWRWHPGAAELAVDVSPEQTTLVEFELTEVDGGALLSLVESGFDAVPADRRLEVFRMNSGGWDETLRSIKSHVDAA